MNNDLVKRLRGSLWSGNRDMLNASEKDIFDAADRIVQLEDALKELLSLGQWGMNDLARTVAREALEGHVKETRKI